MGAKQDTTLTGESAGALGKRDTERLKAAYASSPLYSGVPDELNEDGTLSSKMREWYQANVLDGTQNGNTLTGAVDMDYGTATDVDDVTTGGEGKPAGPRVPTTASPGEGNGSNPAAQPEVDPVTGHNGDLGSIEDPAGSSPTQGSFNLTNLPTVGTSNGS